MIQASVLRSKNYVSVFNNKVRRCHFYHTNQPSELQAGSLDIQNLAFDM